MGEHNIYIWRKCILRMRERARKERMNAELCMYGRKMELNNYYVLGWFKYQTSKVHVSLTIKGLSNKVIGVPVTSGHLYSQDTTMGVS